MILHVLVGEDDKGRRFVLGAGDDRDMERFGPGIRNARSEMEINADVSEHAERWGWLRVRVTDSATDALFPADPEVDGEVVDG